MEFLILRLECLVIGLERIELPLQHLVVPLQLLGLPACPPVLEPYRYLPRLEAQRPRELQLPLRIKLVPKLEALLQRLHLLQVQPLLLLPELGAVIRQVILPAAASFITLLVVVVVVIDPRERRGSPHHVRHIVVTWCARKNSTKLI